jgi:hypothetical protein
MHVQKFKERKDAAESPWVTVKRCSVADAARTRIQDRRYYRRRIYFPHGHAQVAAYSSSFAEPGR